MRPSIVEVPLDAELNAKVAPLRFGECLMLQAFPVLGLLAAGGREVFEQPAKTLLLLATLMLLYLHIFAFNDWSNLPQDRLDERKAGRLRPRSATIFAATPGWIAALAGAALLGLLLLPGTVALCAAVLLLASVAYSHPRIAGKSKPGLSTAIHLLSGAAHFLAGHLALRTADGTAAGLALWCGLVLASGHFVQEAQDLEADRAAGVTTHATRFGARLALIAGLLGFTASYALLALLAATNRLPGVALVLLLLWLPLPALFRRRLMGDSSPRRIAALRSAYRSSFALTALGLAWILASR